MKILLAIEYLLTQTHEISSFFFPPKIYFLSSTGTQKKHYAVAPHTRSTYEYSIELVKKLNHDDKGKKPTRLHF